MSFTPSVRLLWAVALLFVPACALPALAHRGGVYAALTGCAIVLAALADLLLSRRSLEGFRLQFPPDIRAVLNEPQTFALALHAFAAHRPGARSLRLAAALPPAIESISTDIVLSVPASASGISAQMSFSSSQRGEYSISQAFLGADSLLRLWHLRKSLPVHSRVLVQPSLASIFSETAKLLASHRHGGHRIVARNGRGREFEQLREYVPSDDFGDIDWKATARRRAPVVREYQIERTQDIYACVDFSRLSARAITRRKHAPSTILDEYIRSTLMLHSAVRHAGDRFGLVTFSDRVHHFAKASNANAFDPVFRQALYPLRPRLVAPAFDHLSAALRARAKRRALFVLFTSLAEPQLAEAFLSCSRLLARQHLLLVACPADESTQPLFSDSTVDAGPVQSVNDLYGKLAGHLLWKKLAEVRSRLAVSGIRMHIVPPGRLGLDAAAEYLDIKERQLL
ncbi:MAG: DUF58 domain-containing protein [Acidobacteriaceae bacterium]|nr:DUF58 domain-containing protein [Acidobacteriaceae bacterium]